jgi:tetratricopeptide (TPR) repeat protein
MGDLSSTRPVPAASGSLSRTPLVHLLLYALDKRLAGTVEFTSPDRRAASVVFVSGRPAKVRTEEEPGLDLGRSLVGLGYLTEAQRERSFAELTEARTAGPMLHGQILLRSGLIDEEQLAVALRDQLERKLGRIAAFPADTSYEYLSGFDGLQGWGLEVTHGQDPVPMVWGILRQSPPSSHIDAALERVAASPLRLARTAQLARLSLDREESAAVELLRVRPLRIDELAVTSGLGSAQTRLLAYLLLVTKQVDVLRPGPSRPSEVPPSSLTTPVPPPRPREPSVASSPPPLRSPPPPPRSPVPPPSGSMPPARPAAPPSSLRPAPRFTMPPSMPQPSRPPSPPTSPPPQSAQRSVPPPPPKSLSPELLERWTEIIDRAATIDRADYFTMLEIARDATHSDVEAAFYAQAKRWHPDRLPPELAPVRVPCSRVFARMSEAHATLADDEQRARYMKLVAEGSGSPEMQETLAKVVEAATAFQKAEVCFRRNDLVQAETLCRKALDLDPTQPDYHALLAWLIALKPESQTVEKTKASIQILERAIGMSERCEKAFFYRAMLYKRLGKGDAAVRDFKRVVNLNPRNIDAAREVRLYRMRGGRRTSNPPAVSSGAGSDPPRPDEGKPSIFGRLFKK